MGDAERSQRKHNSFWGHAKRNGVLAAARTKLRFYIMKLRWLYLVKCWGMDIHPDTWLSLKVKLDRTNPKGIHIGEGTLVAFDAVILSHDFIRRIHDVHTVIGKNCLIGARSFIMPGVTIGDQCIIGAMTVVTKDIPSNCMVVGNPGVVVKTGVTTGRLGNVINPGERVTP